MEEKERFEFGQRTLFDSGEEVTTFDGFNLDDFMQIICKLLNQQDKQIKELQQQLAENNEFFNAFACKDFNEFKDFISTFMLAPHEEQTLIRELKQQLAVTEKALELACEEITGSCKYCSYKTMIECPIEADCLDEKINYFKSKAKEMLGNE